MSGSVQHNIEREKEILKRAWKARNYRTRPVDLLGQARRNRQRERLRLEQLEKKRRRWDSNNKEKIDVLA